jgi:hypothetical protein
MQPASENKMKVPAIYIYVFSICTALCSAKSWAQSGPPASISATTSPAPRAIPEILQAISDHLQSDDPAVVTQAVGEIHELLQTRNQKNGNVFRSVWLKHLLDLQRYDDVADLSLPAILAAPSDTQFVEQVQGMKVQALLGEGKPADALFAAKQLFNIATLKGTADAIRAVCQCLNAVHPDDRNVLKQYRNEQINGAALNSTTAPVSASILAGVQIDPAAYQPAIRGITAEDFRSLTGQGNLMLLSGNTKDAWDVFERAYTMASDRDLPAASENLARCIKAQDGTIGRANAWILSIRPKAQMASARSAGADLPATQPTHQE